MVLIIVWQFFIQDSDILVGYGSGSLSHMLHCGKLNRGLRGTKKNFIKYFSTWHAAQQFPDLNFLTTGQFLDERKEKKIFSQRNRFPIFLRKKHICPKKYPTQYPIHQSVADGLVIHDLNLPLFPNLVKNG